MRGILKLIEAVQPSLLQELLPILSSILNDATARLCGTAIMSLVPKATLSADSKICDLLCDALKTVGFVESPDGRPLMPDVLIHNRLISAQLAIDVQAAKAGIAIDKRAALPPTQHTHKTMHGHPNHGSPPLTITTAYGYGQEFYQMSEQHHGHHDGGYVAVKQEDLRHDSGASCVSMSVSMSSYLAYMPPPGLTPPATQPKAMPLILHEPRPPHAPASPLQPASQVSRNESDVRAAEKEGEGGRAGSRERGGSGRGQQWWDNDDYAEQEDETWMRRSSPSYSVSRAQEPLAMRLLHCEVLKHLFRSQYPDIKWRCRGNLPLRAGDPPQLGYPYRLQVMHKQVEESCVARRQMFSLPVPGGASRVLMERAMRQLENLLSTAASRIWLADQMDQSFAVSLSLDRHLRAENASSRGSYNDLLDLMDLCEGVHQHQRRKRSRSRSRSREREREMERSRDTGDAHKARRTQE
ncbi:unnamed protein product [Vitrella brassicaformis CCMP3155]|uniref:Uncharacterized protein n=1 Tax=Vitrella brassicaformis (strain CCMP3155) TaxID=1169540 RepID=A0A0G4GY89_VITBC|nr:unnamed protein product [Vitrella brassicaformis CCMP3155]|eukprot:CEM36092.1 unnamed protein product [Vitrella brassicaformis CCMP3155]